MVRRQSIPVAVVVEGDARYPFSRGILSQSLMASGLDLEAAYGIATEVQRKLRAGKFRTISKTDLKQLAADLLRSKYGEDVVQKFLRWREMPPEILIEDGESQIPFSKGVLSQSLRAAGLDPAEVHGVARNIEHTILKSGRRSISREELRQTVHDALERDFGQRQAERYLFWRDLTDLDKPLTLLLGGATGSGKSAIAVELAHRLGISRVISTDAVRQIMRTMFSEELMPSIHQSSYAAWKNIELPIPEDQDPVIVGLYEQALRVRVGVHALIDRAIEENVSMIIEGVHIIPGFYSLEHERTHLVSILLTVEDDSQHRDRFHFRSRSSKRRGLRKYLKSFDAIRAIQDHLIFRARRHGVQTVDNQNFDHTVLTVLEVLAEAISRGR